MADDLVNSALTSSAGFIQHDYKPRGKAVERVIYSALPAICLSSTVFPAGNARQITVDETLDLTVYGDVVMIYGRLKLAGRNIKIVARKLIFLGEAAGIVTDGEKGKKPDPNNLGAPADKPFQARRGDSAADGTAGFSATDRDEHGKLRIADGASADPGTAAGTIEVNVEKWVGVATLSACGGKGAAGQKGQDGQDGGDGGNGYQQPNFLPDTPGGLPVEGIIYPPGHGGRGGDAGRGGTGGAGGDAGTITVRWVRAVRSECQACSAALTSAECAQCSQSGDPKPTLNSAGGERGPDGGDGDVGVGGLDGVPFGEPDTMAMAHRFGDAKGSILQHGSVVAIRGEDTRLSGQNFLGAFGDGVYYYSDGYGDKQRWLVERVERDASGGLRTGAGGPIRYGDNVRLTNRYYQQRLNSRWNAVSDRITTSSSDEYWTIESIVGLGMSSEVRVDAPFNLRASDGRVLIMPGGGEVYWYGVAKKVRSRGRAANGVVRAKPSDWHDTKPGKSYDSRPVKIDPSVFYRCWHPAQLWLQVERLKGFYLTAEVGGPRFKALTDELFRWQGMINPLVSDTAVEAAAGDPPLLAPAVKTEFMGPLAKLNDMVNTCILGLDYFGNERDFAPNVTFAYYERALKESLARLEKFEAVYFAFLKKAKEQADLKNAVSEVFEQSVAIVSTAQEQLAKVRLELEQAEALIKARSKIVSQLRSELLKPSGDLDEFKKNIQGFKCDLEAILSGLEMMVFVPPTQTNLEGVTELSGVGVAMAGVQVAKFIQHGLTTIKASDGKEFETENVISSITELEDSVWATAQSAYNDAKGKKIDVGGPRILATLDKLDKLVSQFAGKTSASKLRYDISALVSAVRQRANAIVEFNLKLMRALMLQQIIADADAARVGALKKAADWNDPALPEMLGFLARQYQHMKDAAIERVYLANRAAAFWMLDDGSPHVVDGKVVGGFNVFRDTLEEKAPGWRDVDVYGAIGWNVLSACEARLQDAFDHGIAAHSGVAQVFGSKDAAGDKIIITDEGVLAAFKEGRDGVNQVNIRISRDGAPGTFTGDHLKNYANAHLTTFRVFLNGAFRKEGGNDQFIYIKFKHDSRDEYYNEKEALRTFSRVDLDPGTFAYDGAKGALRYEIDPDTKRETSRFKGGYIHIEGDLGTGGTPQELARDDQHAIYAGVGPFTEWTIVLVPSAKGKVDLSGLSSIEIQLVGIFRTSKASPAATSSTAPILTVEEHQP